MTLNGFMQMLIYVVALVACAKPLGGYMARVYLGESAVNRWFGPAENWIYRLSGVDPK